MQLHGLILLVVFSVKYDAKNDKCLKRRTILGINKESPKGNFQSPSGPLPSLLTTRERDRRQLDWIRVNKDVQVNYATVAQYNVHSF